MKKVAFMIVLFAGLFTACKKEKTADPEPETPVNTADQTPPVISLLGKKNDTIALQSTYSDPGATALDNKDGDISPFIVVSGTVNTALVGNYSKDYNVRDAAGNIAIKATRNIRVQNEVNYLSGNYLVACTCQTIEPGVSTIQNSVNFSASVVPSATINNSINLSSLNTGFAILPVPLSVSGSGISGFLSPGSITGTLSASRTTFTVNTIAYDINYPSRIRECANVYTKQ